jgi:hypothetical protein
MESNRPSRSRVAFWGIATILAALLVIFGVYRWHRWRLWTLQANGRSLCLVQPGWTQDELSANCGPRTGRGRQPKVGAAGSGSLEMRMCSAQGDVYGDKVVLFGCDGKVQTV